MLTMGPGNKQERACALETKQHYVEKPQLTGRTGGSVSATKLFFQKRAETTHGLNREPPIQLLCGQNTKVMAPRYSGTRIQQSLAGIRTFCLCSGDLLPLFGNN